MWCRRTWPAEPGPSKETPATDRTAGAGRAGKKRRPGRADKGTGSWRAGFGRFGDAQYVIGERDVVRVTMLFITWAG